MGSTVFSRRALLRRAAVLGGGFVVARALAVAEAATVPLRMIEHATLRRAANGHLPPPAIVTRAEWGADESRRRTQPSFETVQSLIVHHTVTDTTDDPAADIRNVYRLHLMRDEGRWGDIGYHYLIHPNGHVYEGRWAREYATGEVHDGHSPDGRLVRGVHARGANHGTAGVALVGDFRSERPSIRALSALVYLCAHLCDRHGLDPLAPETIAGHRDSSDTECPGRATYRMLPDLRRWVANVMAGPWVSGTAG